MNRSYLWYLSKDYVCLLNAPNTQVRLELLQGNKSLLIQITDITIRSAV